MIRRNWLWRRGSRTHAFEEIGICNLLVLYCIHIFWKAHRYFSFFWKRNIFSWDSDLQHYQECLSMSHCFVFSRDMRWSPKQVSWLLMLSLLITVGVSYYFISDKKQLIFVVTLLVVVYTIVKIKMLKKRV